MKAILLNLSHLEGLLTQPALTPSFAWHLYQTHRTKPMDLKPPRSRFTKAPLIFLCLCALSCLLQAAPYHGESFTYRQPDGETFTVRIFGDEFFAYEETTDGYLVTKDTKTGVFCYARVINNGTDSVSTGVRVGRAIPQGLKPKQRLTPEAAMAKSRIRRDLMGVDDQGQLKPEWQAKLFPNKAKGKGRPGQQGGEVDVESQIAPTQDADTFFAPGEGEGVIEGDAQSAPIIPVTVNKRVGLVLLASFPDRPGDVSKTHAQIDQYCNAETYTTDGNATSIRGYFLQQSNGKLDYTNVVTAWFVAANNRDYYTDETANGRAADLIREGLVALANQGFDFTQCDADGNGVIDGVNCFYAGARTNNWGKGLWPHKSVAAWAGFGIQGLSTEFQYQITDMPVSLGIATFAHENGHMILNYPDLYSYNGNAATLGTYSLMSSYGSEKHPSSIDAALKISSGWAKVVDLGSSSHQRCVVQIDRNHFYRYSNPSRSGESFVFEVRGNSGYEGTWNGAPANYPTNGLVAYHSLQSGSNTHSTIFTADNPTNYSTPYRLLVVEATPDAAVTPWYRDPSPDSADGFRSGAVAAVSDSTNPALKFWAADGRTIPSQANVHSISVSGKFMSFVIGSGAVTAPAQLGVSTDSLVSTISGATTAPAQEFAVFNVGSGTLNYSVSVDAPWLSISAPSGSVVDGEVDMLTVSYASNLPGGTHIAEITITSPQVANSPIIIPVTLYNEGSPAAPTITTHPSGGHFLGDQNVILSAWALGSPYPTYQWYKNGVAVAGGNSNNLTLPFVTAASAGIYHVVATNSLGSATSSNAVITVNDHPTITWVTPLAPSINLTSGVGLWLEADVTDDGYGGSITTHSWTAQTVPTGGSVSWGNPNSGKTTASFGGNGVYMLRFTASDGDNSRSRDIEVDVGNNTSVVGGGNLIVRYLFNETNGTVAVDAAGGDHNGTIFGSPILDGAPLTLDGIDDKVHLPTSPDIHNGGGPYPKRTIAFHFNAQVVTGKQMLFEEGGVEKGLSMYLDGTTLYWRGWNNGGNGWSFSAMSKTGIQADRWYHMTLVLDATPGGTTLESGVFRGYLDGVLINSRDGAPLDDHNDGCAIGAVNGATASLTGSFNFFKGSINDFVLYNRALSPSEIISLAAQPGIGLTQSGPVVDAGLNTSGIVGQSLQLDATVSAGGVEDPPTISKQWSTFSGPGVITYQNSTVTDAVITANTAGSYVLRLTADDNTIRTFDDVSVEMAPSSGLGYLSLDAGTHAVAESGGSLQIAVNRIGGMDGAISVDYAASDGTATHGLDYNLAPGTLNWADQESSAKYITVNIINDLRAEGSETFSVNLTNPTGGATLSSPNTTTVTILDDDIPDVILFRDEFTAASSTSLTNPSARATGTLASTITYTWPSTTGVVVNGMLSWDNNNSRDEFHQQTDATGSQNLRISNNLYSSVGGKVWEVSFDQRVAWSHPLTFCLSDSSTHNGLWNAWDSADYDFAAGSYGTSLRYDTDNVGGANGPSVPLLFPNPPNSTDTHHFRIRFDEPAGKVILWLNGVKRLDLATLNFATNNRYLSWAEPENFAGALDNLELKVINTVNGAPAWNGNPVSTANAVEETSYSASLASLASDPNDDSLTFAKLSGPAWLTVAADGTLTGTPSGSDVGINSFSVSVTDDLSTAVAVTLHVTVLSHFQDWAAGGTSFLGDANADGIADGLAWLLGAANSGASGNTHLPTSQRSNEGGLVLSFRCLNDANRGAATLSLQFSQDLGLTDPWSNHVVVIPETNHTDVASGVVFAITPNGNFNEITATIPASAAGTSGKLFSRLMATE